MPLALRAPGRQNARRNRPKRAIRCGGSTAAAGIYGLRVETLNNPLDFFDRLARRAYARLVSYAWVQPIFTVVSTLKPVSEMTMTLDSLST